MQPLRTKTTTALLQGLFDPSNEAVWREFDDRYRPIILSIAKKLGLDDADAADVAQETLTRFIQEYRAGQYDRRRGPLRSWIIGIVKYRIADLQRTRTSRREERGESALAKLATDEELTLLWEAERRRALLWQAVAELREQTKLTEKTICAFELYVVQEIPAGEVALELGITSHDVYMAKNRVAERLRATLERLGSLFDDG